MEKKKDRRKIFKGILQGLILLSLFILLINSIFNFKEYKDYPIEGINKMEDRGFIALSYLAVDRKGSNTMISTKRLAEHLQGLKLNGYQTIKQGDIENYYKNNQVLPNKSLFLMFEDGRRDTAIFTTPLLEDYNYIATVLTYANKFEEKDPKFLSPKDLIKLEKSSFWEMGSNGYRLAYINVFDRYDNYLGELHSDEYSKLHKYIGRNYNHYLMDYIRDEKKIPKESYNQMKTRITNDYLSMEEIYGTKLGRIPKTYVLMHSNTGQYGSNKNVSQINEDLIKKYFQMNFNREGYSLNNKDSDIYDLTRIQPQAYWYTNHLLMRIKHDTREDIIFVEGESQVRKDWEVIKGASEFKKSAIIVTSEPEDKGLIRLNQEPDKKNYIFQTKLRGNLLGSQTVYLRADEDLKEYLAVNIKDNWLYIEEDGKKIFALDLDLHDEKDFQSIDENMAETLEAEYKIYKKNIKKSKTPSKMEEQMEIEDYKVKSVEEGADEYIPAIEINQSGSRELEIHLKDNNITVAIDGKEAIKDLIISEKTGNHIYLQSAWSGHGYSQRNIADDVYDGVFEDILISNIEDPEDLIYINKLQGKELVIDKMKTRWNKVINWFIRNL